MLKTPVPPVHRVLGLTTMKAANGRARVRLSAAPALLDGAGRLLPGALALLADTGCGTAVATVFPPGSTGVTAQLKIEFIRPVREGAAWIESVARTYAATTEEGYSRADLTDDSGRVVGVATLRVLAVPYMEAEPLAGQWQTDDAHDDLTTFLGITERTSSPDGSQWRLSPGPVTANTRGAVHGGILGLLAASVAETAHRSVAGPGDQVLPLDLVLSYYRSLPADGTSLSAVAAVRHRGRRFVEAEGRLIGADGRTAVHFSSGARLQPSTA
jgi:uncharacterized protein (TIGR00369 family)